MKKTIRYYGAIAMSKVIQKGMSLFGRNSTHLPGYIALKIDPNLFDLVPKPQHRIAITGTNGKTSVSNLVAEFLRTQNVSLVNNSYGSNYVEGTLGAILDGINLRGNRIADYSVLEIDELASRFILEKYQPQLMAITNLFRDSYRRNAHVDYVFNTLNENIGDNTHLILNADDLISCQLKPDNTRTYFSIAPLDPKISSVDDLINDLPICPVCDHTLEYQFQHYHHLGKAICPNCKFTNPTPDYQITQLIEDHFVFQHKNREFTVYTDTFNLANLYNLMVAIVILHELGFELEKIVEYLKSPNIPKTRYEVYPVKNKTFITIMGKDQNPVAVTRAFDYIRLNETEKNVGIIIINQVNYQDKENENIAYLYDVNFEYLNQPHIKRIGIGSARYLDYQARLEFSGYPKNQIIARPNELDLINDFPIHDLDCIYLIPGTKTMKENKIIRNELIKRI